MKNSKPVALERRYDLASLFCMIGRHGPAVAMAVIAMLSVMAAFVIYRTVRGKRRKATAAANSGNTLVAEGDAAVSEPGPEPSREETHSSAESTEESDEGSPDLLEEDADQIQGNLEIGERCTAAVEKKPRLCSAPEPVHAQGLMYQAADRQHAHRDAPEETAVARQPPGRDVNACNGPETFAEEVNREPEMEAEDVARGNAEDESTEDVAEEDRDNQSCLKEPEVMDYESCHEEELDQACEAEYQEAAASVCPDEDTPTELCVETTPEDEDFQCAVNEPLSQTPHIHDDKTTQEREDKDEDSTEKLRPDEEKKYEGQEEEAEEEEGVDYQLIAQQHEILAKTAEEEMPFSQLPSVYQQPLNEQHDQREHVMDKMTLFTCRGVDDDDDGGLAGQVIEKDGDEDVDHLSDLPAVTHGPHLSCLSEQQVQIEPEDENHRTQEDGVLPCVADHLKEKTVASDDAAARVISEDRDDSGVVLGPAPPSLSQPSEQEKRDDGHGGSPDVVTEAEGRISSVVDCPPLSSCQQSEQKEDEDETAPSLDGYNNVPMHDPHLPSCDGDQQSDHMVHIVFNKADMAADPDTVACDGENVMPGSVLLPFYQESEKMSNNDALSMDHTTADGEDVPASILDDVNPPMYRPHFLLFDESEKRVSDDDDSKSSPGVEESGISSMTLSSDLYSTPLCKDYEYDVSTPFTDEDMDLSVMDVGPYPPSCHQPQRLAPMETRHNQFDDVSKPVVDEDGGIARMVFGPYPTPVYQQPHRELTGEAIGEPFGGNEDVLGQVIEERYNREIDHFSEKITSLTDELNKQTEVKEEKKEGGNVDRKEGPQSEEDKGEDYEKTEISIMEATMDNNEWMTDGTYQVLPWMSFAQNHTITDQLPAEEHQHDPTITTAVPDAASMDAAAVDITTPTEDKQTSVLSLVDENSKKVVAVQPMPQSVNVTFCVHYLTHFPGQTVAVTGNQQELGSWTGFIPLERAKDGYWASVISLPAESQVEWKFVLVEEGEVCRWEECDNRFLDTGYGDDLHVHKCWGFL